MEYLTQVLTKSLTDSSNDDIINWYDENQTYISKRNELILGPWRMIITKGDGVLAIAGSNENKYGNIFISTNLLLINLFRSCGSNRI
jgi:hypothetical protein